ncbi:LAQU0S01e05974g1_1 [Lachancea quebecensis]|uniref:Autophagy protein 5 n=1 Tax=Lachancea quebecensis TaxID=1654605 RepID=A0A0P1KM15_9SACH|nr:LAQU0S01e05974g1_1 [Lachancea quebecensis]
MDSVRGRAWAGSLNLRITVYPDLLLSSSSQCKHSINFKVPRETYLVFYFPYILERIATELRNNVTEHYNGWWVEMEGVPLSWNFPVGVLYDSLTGLDPLLRSSKHQSNSINVWELTLRHGAQSPSSIIPIVRGTDQIREFWMHQWKQACFILNGASKQMMSLSKPDTMKFWNSVLRREQNVFDAIREKILPILENARFIPLRVHLALPQIRLLEPQARVQDNNGLTSLGNVLNSEFPEWFSDDPSRPNLAKAIIQGIEVPLQLSLWHLYQELSSFDGFLHVSLCLMTEDASLTSHS